MNTVNTSFWKINTTCTEALVAPDGVAVSLAGRVVAFRLMGGVAFGRLVDQSGRIQFSFNKREMDAETFKAWSNNVHLGDIIGISGVMITSSTGEKTVLVNQDFTVLRRPLLSWPDKHVGVVDPEVKLRKRYLDCLINPEVRDVFRTRSRVISFIRRFLEGCSFMEVETPVLTSQASGAQARPFRTHHNALDRDLFLRIAPETYLKRAVAAGYDRVFEIGKNFRNEGIDPSHLQEFTAVEWYGAYMTANDNMDLFVHMMTKMAAELYGKPGPDGLTIVDPPEVFKFLIPGQVKYRQLFVDEIGRNPDEFSSAEADRIFKTQIRPKITDNLFITDYPAHLAPMAARKANDPQTADMWQYLSGGWEIVKCYTELTDPVLQRQLLNEQAAARASGDEEAMALEEDFLECMEHGMPPMSGLGIGIDRLVALITDQKTLRDVVLFPTLLNK